MRPFSLGLAILAFLLLAQLCLVRADADVVAHDLEPRAVDAVEDVQEVEQVESWPDGLAVTVLFTGSNGNPPIILHNVPILSGSVSPFSSSSGPKIPGGAIAGLIVGIVLLWTLCLLLCLILILAIAMASGGTRFSEGTVTSHHDTVDAAYGTKSSTTFADSNKTTIEFTDTA